MRDVVGQVSASRRTFLGSVAGVTAGRAVSTVEGAGPSLSVMTRNLYLGVDLSRLFEAQSEADVRRIAGELLADLQRRPFRARAEALAVEVDEHRPDVVGVQEAALVRTQHSGEFSADSASDDTAVVVDFLEVLSSALEDRGLEYEVATAVVTTDVEVPADGEISTGGENPIDGEVEPDGEQEPGTLRLTDRVALFVRGEVEVHSTTTGTYDADVAISLEEDTVTLDRGYCLADVVAADVEVAVAATHLESVNRDVRLRQAAELLDALPSDRPVVLAADLNDGPESPGDAYELLTESLEDAHATLRPGEDGFTCCQAADLRNDRPRLSRRIDAVLSRGLRPTAVERVGEGPDDRVTVSIDRESVRLWPSDHAGVVATLEATRSTGGETTPAAPGDRTPSSPLPGFGALVAIVAILIAALARRRR